MLGLISSDSGGGLMHVAMVCYLRTQHLALIYTQHLRASRQDTSVCVYAHGVSARSLGYISSLNTPDLRESVDLGLSEIFWGSTRRYFGLIH